MQTILESLKRQRDQLLTDSSDEMLSRHTSLLEIAIISLYNRLANRLDTEHFRSSVAVLAIGSFGRGLTGPGETVPILFLQGEPNGWKGGHIEEIVSPLTDSGWSIETMVGSVEQLLDRCREDFGFFLRLLEARYVSGSRPLVDHLEKALDGWIESGRDALLEKLAALRRERESRLEKPESWLEPSLEEDPGGVGDIAAIRAACRIAGSIRGLEDAIFRGFLTREEVDKLQQAEKTYARLISLLQTLGNGHRSVLRFDDQATLASKLGYSGRVGFLPVEALMQQVHQMLHNVVCIALDFWERLDEIRVNEEESPLKEATVLEEGLLARSGKIVVQPDRYQATPGHLVHLFALAAEKGLGFSNVTRQWIQHHRNVLDSASGDLRVKGELMSLFASDGPELTGLRRLYNMGLGVSLIPDLAKIHGLVQHDAFHLYPVHEHHLRTVSILKRLLAGDYREEEPELTPIAESIEDRSSLLLAGLLHDIGKSAGKGHALHGGEMIPAIARRLGLTPEESDRVQFLVAQHLLLMDSASLRDLADEEMLAHCALTVRTPDQLDLLLVLSFADMTATGPRGHQKWRDTPVLALCERVRTLLEKGEPSPEATAERVDRIRTQVGRELEDVMDSSELEAFFSQLAPRYLFSTAPSAIARHVRMQWQLQHTTEPFVSEASVKDRNVEITLVSWDTPALLSRTAGVLTLHDLNIVGAQVFTMNNGVTLLIFQCRLAEATEGSPDWTRVWRDMRRLLEGKLALDYRIAAHAASREALAAPFQATPSKILIDNESAARYTILEVFTTDRIGLLYAITRTLLELQIRVYVAKITTKIDQVADVFYIRTHHGDKVTDPEQIGEIRKALCFWLDGPIRE